MPMGNMPKMRVPGSLPITAQAPEKKEEENPVPPERQLEIEYKRRKALPPPPPGPLALERGDRVPAGSRRVTSGEKPFQTGKERDLPRRRRAGRQDMRPGKPSNPNIKEAPKETDDLNKRFGEGSWSHGQVNTELTESQKMANHLKTIGLHNYVSEGSSGVPTATGRPSANEVNKARQALLRQHHPDFAKNPADRTRREKKSAEINEAADRVLRMR